MTDQLRKAAQDALDALLDFTSECKHMERSLPGEVDTAIDALREALAQPDPQPVAQIHVKNGHWIDTPFAQTEDLADGLHPLYTAPVAAPEPQPMRWIDVSERVPGEAQIVLFVLNGKVVVGAWIAGIFWYDNAKQVATAWMPLPPPPEFGVGGYPVTAPPSREWQELSPLEMQDTLRNCAASTFDKLAPNWYEVRQFARAIESALRAKNAVPERVPLKGLHKEAVIAAADSEYRKKGAGACDVQTWEDYLIRAAEAHHGIKEQK